MCLWLVVQEVARQVYVNIKEQTFDGILDISWITPTKYTLFIYYICVSFSWCNWKISNMWKCTEWNIQNFYDIINPTTMDIN